MAQLDGVVQADRLASVREALALRERLVAATRQSPYHVARLATAQRLAQRIGQ